MAVLTGPEAVATLRSGDERFTPNMAFAVYGGGYATTVNITNYFGPPLFAESAASIATAVLDVWSADGTLLARHSQLVAVSGSAHIDIGQLLAVDATTPLGFATVYVRLIPETVPDQLTGPALSTEYTSEIRTPTGTRSFFHNTLGPVLRPAVGRMESGQILSGSDTRTATLILPNNYLGPRWPGLSGGRAVVEIENGRGQRLRSTSERIPPGGLSPFPLESVGDLQDFLQGGSGILRLRTWNVLRKPWVWFTSAHDPGAVSIEHL